MRFCSSLPRYICKPPAGRRRQNRSFRGRLPAYISLRSPERDEPLRHKPKRHRGGGTHRAPNLRYRRIYGKALRVPSLSHTLCREFFCERALVRRARRAVLWLRLRSLSNRGSSASSRFAGQRQLFFCHSLAARCPSYYLFISNHSIII